MTESKLPAFLQACISDHALARSLLQEDRGLLDEGVVWGDPPLSYFIIEGQVQAAEFLIHEGADPNQRDLGRPGDDPAISESTPLIYACRKSLVGIVDLLLEHGANPNLDYELEDSPLHRAASRGCLPIVESLLGAGADPNKRGGELTPALLSAVEIGDARIVAALLQHGADGLWTSSLETILHALERTRGSQVEIMQRLSAFGVSVERVWERWNQDCGEPLARSPREAWPKLRLP